MAANPRRRIVGSRAAPVVRMALAATAAMLCMMSFLAAAETATENTMVVQEVFRSYSCADCTQQPQTDGPSGVGTLFRANGGTLSTDGFSLLLCDGGGGSTVRVVNRGGITTIAGSRVRRGMHDGSVTEALFNSPSSVVRVGQTVYVADTDNNRIRRITSDGRVTTFLDPTRVSGPQHILPYRRPEGTYDLFVADTGNNRIIFTPLLNSTFYTVFFDRLQASSMQIDENRGVMFVVRDQSQIIAIDMRGSGSSPHSWNIGNINCMGYQSSLMLTDDGSELIYYGNNGGTAAIMAVAATASESDSPQLCPRVVMRWTNGNIVSLVRVNSREFYAVTAANVYTVRDGNYTLTPTVVITPTISEPSSGENVTSTLWEPTSTLTLSSSDSLLNRDLAVAAFPTVALPTFDDLLMHQLYSWLMKDVGIAFGTDNFLAVFQPRGYVDVHGTVNVSTWRNLTTLRSHDGTIVITEYVPPSGMSLEDAQRHLFDSPWYWTRMFLDAINRTNPEFALQPFCMIACVECVELSYSNAKCAPPGWYNGPCNDVCVGAIVSSVVLGGTGAALIALMVRSSSNLRNAFVRVPAF